VQCTFEGYIFQKMKKVFVPNSVLTFLFLAFEECYIGTAYIAIYQVVKGSYTPIMVFLILFKKLQGILS